MADQQKALEKYRHAIETIEKLAKELVGEDNGFVCMFIPSSDDPKSIPYLISNAAQSQDIIWLLEGVVKVVKEGRTFDPRIALRES